MTIKQDILKQPLKTLKLSPVLSPIYDDLKSADSRRVPKDYVKVCTKLQHIKVGLDRESAYIDYGDKSTGAQFSRVRGRITIDIDEDGQGLTLMYRVNREGLK